MAAAGGHWVKGSFQKASSTTGVEVFPSSVGADFLVITKDTPASAIDEHLIGNYNDLYPAVWDNQAKRWYIGQEPYGRVLHEDMMGYGKDIGGPSAKGAEEYREQRYSKAFYLPYWKQLEAIAYQPSTVEEIVGGLWGNPAPGEIKRVGRILEKSTSRVYDHAFPGVEVRTGFRR